MIIRKIKKKKIVSKKEGIGELARRAMILMSLPHMQPSLSYSFLHSAIS